MPEEAPPQNNEKSVNDRLAEIEERLNSVEDLLLINKFDVMKMQEDLEKGAPTAEGAPSVAPPADMEKLKQKIDEIEAAVLAVTNTAETDMERAKELASRMTGKIDVSVLKNLEEKVDALSKRVEDVEKRPLEAAVPSGTIDMESIRKAVGGDLDTIRRTFLEDIGRKSEAINARISDLEKAVSAGGKPVQATSIDENKITENVKKAVQEELKLFALNSDLDKLWKLYEEQRKYVDERAKLFGALQDQITVWEERAKEMQMTKKTFDDMLKAFPEMNLLQSKLSAIERKLLDLQRHVVATKISQPIVLE